jgi:hypothetical protein
VDAGKCSKCNSDNEWLPDWKENVEQAVEVMKYGEDDAWYEVEDVTYPIWYSASHCTNPECGYIFMYDVMGGLGSMTKAEYEKRSGHKVD